MKKTARKQGRPRSVDRSALTSALIERQDSLSRRVARTIAHILDTHLPADEVDHAAAWMRARTAARIDRFPREWSPTVMAALAGGVSAIEQVMKTLAYSLLRELATDTAEPPPMPPRPHDPVLVRPGRLGASRSLAEARARGARLQSQLLDLKGRIVR